MISYTYNRYITSQRWEIFVQRTSVGYMNYKYQKKKKTKKIFLTYMKIEITI